MNPLSYLLFCFFALSLSNYITFNTYFNSRCREGSYAYIYRENQCYEENVSRFFRYTIHNQSFIRHHTCTDSKCEQCTSFLRNVDVCSTGGKIGINDHPRGPLVVSVGVCNNPKAYPAVHNGSFCSNTQRKDNNEISHRYYCQNGKPIVREYKKWSCEGEYENILIEDGGCYFSRRFKCGFE